MAIYDQIANQPLNFQPAQSFAAGQKNRLAMQHGEQDLEAKKMAAHKQVVGEIAQFAKWADTPEKWDQGVEHLARMGMPMADQLKGRFDMRDSALAFVSQQQGQMPSSVREYEYYNKLPQKSQQEFMGLKRAGYTLGGQRYGAGTEVGLGGPVVTAEETAKGEATVAAAKKRAEKVGTETGAAEANLADVEAAIPHLNDIVGKLSALGKKATYTKAGVAKDEARRQLGMDVGEGAIARKEYMAVVDNEVLPLLRQTFGAAFTVAEGESLRATLGDVNASPEEKDAVLRAFIQAKIAQVSTLSRRIGKEPAQTKQTQQPPQIPQDGGTPKAGDIMDGYKFLGGDPADPNSWEQQ